MRPSRKSSLARFGRFRSECRAQVVTTDTSEYGLESLICTALAAGHHKRQLVLISLPGTVSGKYRLIGDRVGEGRASASRHGPASRAGASCVRPSACIRFARSPKPVAFASSLSSAERTTAWSGGSTRRPTTSRALIPNLGSRDTLKVLTRCGPRPFSFRMPCRPSPASPPTPAPFGAGHAAGAATSPGPSGPSTACATISTICSPASAAGPLPSEGRSGPPAPANDGSARSADEHGPREPSGTGHRLPTATQSAQGTYDA